jgi:hypothetical protein
MVVGLFWGPDLTYPDCRPSFIKTLVDEFGG